MNTKDKGDLCEIKVAAALTEAGYVVSIPWGDNQRYDMLIDDGQTISKVQCKHGRLRSGAVKFNTSSGGTGKYSEPKGYAGEVDFFGVYCPDTKKCYLVGVDEVGSGGCSLRIDEPSQKRVNIKWAKDYSIGM